MKEKTILFQYNIDSYGNPTSTKIKEVAQVSPLKYTIQLEQIPDEQFGVTLLNNDNTPMIQVFNYDDVEKTENSYYVNYTNGLIYFNSNQGTEKKIINYYGTGVELISCKRVFDGHYDANGKWIVEILQDIIDAGREAIEAMKTIGDVMIILQMLSDKIAEGELKLQKLQDAIDEANDLAKITENERIIINESDWVYNSTTKLYEYTITHTMNSTNLIINCYNKDTNEFVFCAGKIIDASSVLMQIEEKVNLKVILNARYFKASDFDYITEDLADKLQDAIDEANDLIGATGNEEVIIDTSDWVDDGNGSYYAIVNHPCASERIHVTFKRTVSKENMLLGYTIIDNSSFKVFNREKVQTTCIINAMYYRATKTISDDIAVEVQDARGVYTTLKDRFDAINTDVESELHNIETELSSLETKLTDIQMKIEANSSSKTTIYTFNDFAKAVINGEEFKIAFYGDSEVDGNTTTGYVANTLGNISSSTNTFSNYLQNYIERFTGNTKKNIINAGFSGKDANWGNANFENHFLNGNISGVKMIGIGFGINDRLRYRTEKDYYQGFYNNIKSIIKKCFDNNIQPFLLTTQATNEVGGNSAYDATYPLRNTYYINACANKAKKDLAELYGLELIDLNSFTDEVLTMSNYNIDLITKDNLHFTDLGHKLEAGYIFKCIFDNCIVIDENKHISFSNQKIKTDMKMEKLTRTTLSNFKTIFNYAEPTIGKKVMDFWIFNYKSGYKLIARKNSNYKMTCLINENETTVIEDNQIIADLDIGLYHIVVKNKGNYVDFNGFSILGFDSDFVQNGITLETSGVNYSLLNGVLTIENSSSKFAPMFIKRNGSYCNQLFIDTSNFLNYNLGKTCWLVLGGTEDDYIAVSFTNNISDCQGIIYNIKNKTSGNQLAAPLEKLKQFNCGNKLLISVIEGALILTNAFGEATSVDISSCTSGRTVRLGLMLEGGGISSHMPFKLRIS